MTAPEQDKPSRRPRMTAPAEPATPRTAGAAARARATDAAKVATAQTTAEPPNHPRKAHDTEGHADAARLAEARLADARPDTAPSVDTVSARTDAPASDLSLSALTAALNRHSLAHAIGLLTPDTPADIPCAEAGKTDDAPMPRLDMLGYFRDIWSQLHTQQQIRQSQVQVPDNAGPLNSSRIISQALARLQTLSPAYLRELLAYLDTLAQLESLPTPTPAKPSARPAAAGRKPSPARKTNTA